MLEGIIKNQQPLSGGGGVDYINCTLLEPADGWCDVIILMESVMNAMHVF